MIDSLVRSVVAAAPKRTKLTQLAGPRPITFRYEYATAHAAGCEFVARGADTASSDELFDSMKLAFEKARWTSMGGTYSADGPDGSDVGYSKDGLLCVLEGRWDGGDDTEPDIKPSPDFDVFVTCAPLRADDRPPP
jgi:hypothetical protein